ncbi:MAG: class I SAM-dependent methyltransferase [Acidimicrobiales bacterium]
MTAQRVAAHRLGFERVATNYGNAAADMALATDVAGWPQHGMSSGTMHDYLRVRTAFFDRAVVGALEKGFTQVVIGAAGYDGRALRYAKPGVTWFEVDLPSTQQDKVARLRRLQIGTGHVRFVEADFASDPVTERLLAAGLSASSSCLFLLEGVAVYLERGVLERALRQFRQAAGPASRLVISMSIDSDSHDPEARSRFREAVASIGEPARLTLELSEAIELLASTGWQDLGMSAAESSFDENSDEDNDEDSDEAVQQRRRSVGLLIAKAVA